MARGGGARKGYGGQGQQGGAGVAGQLEQAAAPHAACLAWLRPQELLQRHGGPAPTSLISVSAWRFSSSWAPLRRSCGRGQGGRQGAVGGGGGRRHKQRLRQL